MRTLCAICDVTNATTDICPECRADPVNADWCTASDMERSAEDVDATVAIVGGARLESVFGGKRKYDTPLAHKVVRVALRLKSRSVWRYRMTAESGPMRRRKRVERGVTLRRIAHVAGCSVEYVRLVLGHHLS